MIFLSGHLHNSEGKRYEFPKNCHIIIEDYKIIYNNKKYHYNVWLIR